MAPRLTDAPFLPHLAAAAAAVLQVSAEFAAVLQSCGLLVNSMGGETVMDLATYTFSGESI
jgi:lysylphosphatidylglycerol synthetase-like protein (DUF2156 family)